VVTSLDQGVDCLHMIQLMPLPTPNPVISCLQFQDWFYLLVLDYPGCPGKEAIKGCSSSSSSSTSSR